MPTTYSPAAVEAARYEQWVADGVFTADPRSGKTPYAIVIPPPNVTGSLHMGHAFQHTLMDALVRRRRMQGYDALWLPGTDHAGIATQNVVERVLANEGRSRQDLGREAFVERVWQWRAEYGDKILGQMRRLGEGVDWTRERFTMDEGLSRAVRTVFKRLYDDDLIYRAERIINWCPRCQTALSDIEVEHREIEGELVSISYGPVTVATTRAETMLGDTAVAVHPDDERYRHLVGQEVALPLTNRRIPIIADDHVDASFGTGAVKVTPAHDPNDFEIGQRNGLPAVVMMDLRANITVPGPFQGLDRFEARPAVVAALRAQGLLVDERRPYLHSVGHCSRCGTIVEPRLSLQWFVRVGPLAKRAGDAVRRGDTAFSPPEMAQRYFDWVDSMHDWCISRQLWWGHRIPVWYGPDGQSVVPGPDDAPPAGEGWQQDEDVLDTWFSSALWPASTLGWPDDTEDLRRYYPTDVLLTGYDIIFFWVARMMMFCTYVQDEVPFRTVSITGLIRDARGRKMSKSAGNVVDPLDWIEQFGADALRWSLARGANPGVDVPVSAEWVEGSRNFINKIWNAARFALLHGADPRPQPPGGLTAADRWILSRLTVVRAQVDELYEQFEWAKICDVLHHFAWDDLCDWYLELSKLPLRAGGAAAARVQAVLGHVFDVLLRMLHPIIPFVTEELWTALTGEHTLTTAAWPQPADPRDPVAETEIARVQELVREVRRFRAEQGLRPGQTVPAVLVADAALTEYAQSVGTLSDLRIATAQAVPDAWPALHAAGAHLGLDLFGAIDVAAERARLTRALEASQRELGQVTAKLSNAGFLGKAPAAVVERTRQRKADARAEVDRVTALLDRLPAQ
ncbi:MAG: valine--tRNA ligase [Frankiaceae bacterium]